MDKGEILTLEMLEKDILSQVIIPEVLRPEIKHVQFFRWPGSSLVSCCVTLRNLHQELGSSFPINRIISRLDKVALELSFQDTFEALLKEVTGIKTQ